MSHTVGSAGAPVKNTTDDAHTYGVLQHRIQLHEVDNCLPPQGVLNKPAILAHDTKALRLALLVAHLPTISDSQGPPHASKHSPLHSTPQAYAWT
eukprot:2719093-Amphidinium_carterae.1